MIAQLGGCRKQIKISGCHWLFILSNLSLTHFFQSSLFRRRGDLEHLLHHSFRRHKRPKPEHRRHRRPITREAGEVVPLQRAAGPVVGVHPEEEEDVMVVATAKEGGVIMEMTTVIIIIVTAIITATRLVVAVKITKITAILTMAAAVVVVAAATTRKKEAAVVVRNNVAPGLLRGTKLCCFIHVDLVTRMPNVPSNAVPWPPFCRVA